MERRTPTPTAASVQTHNSLSINPVSSIQKNANNLSKKKKKNANKKRFSDQQIKFLEFMFESESRPESVMKQQLAGELGLQPRQIAIWFQNRRARSKSKQIEKEYKTLKVSYDALASSFESLKTENRSLLTQLQTLKNLHIKHNGTRHSVMDQTRNSSNGTYKSGDTDSGSEERPSLPIYGYDQKPDLVQSDHNNSRSIENTSDNADTMKANDDKARMNQSDQNSINIKSIRGETDILDLTEYTDGSVISSGWHIFDSSCFLDESTSNSKWWEFSS